MTISSPLSLFNGPRVHGRPSLIAHAYETLPGAADAAGPDRRRTGPPRPLRLPGQGPAAADRRRLRLGDPRRSEDRPRLQAPRQEGRLLQRRLQRRQAAGPRHADLRQRRLRSDHVDHAVPHPALRLAIACCAALALAAALAAGAGAGGASVEYRDLALRANGGFAPRTLPRKRFAPIQFEGHFDIANRYGGQPRALERAVIRLRPRRAPRRRRPADLPGRARRRRSAPPARGASAAARSSAPGTSGR